MTPPTELDYAKDQRNKALDALLVAQMMIYNLQVALAAMTSERDALLPTPPAKFP